MMLIQADRPARTAWNRPAFRLSQAPRFGLSFFGPSLTPREIKDKIDEHIIGQEEAKTTVAVAAYDHLKRMGAIFSARSLRELLNKQVFWGPSEDAVKKFTQELARVMRKYSLQDEAIKGIIVGFIENGLKSSILRPKERPDRIADSLVEGLIKEQKLKEMDAFNERLNTVQVKKQNIIVIGPTGSGKTEIARTLAGIMDIPFAFQQANALTSTGYVGDDAEDIAMKLLDAADNDEELAGRGIVFLDEVDKIKSTEGREVTRDIGGKGAQDVLLPYLEDKVVHLDKQNKKVDMRNVLFVMAGAFVGLEEIIEERLKDEGLIQRKTIGFGTQSDQVTCKDKRELLKYVTPEDLINFGMSPEFVGRSPVIVNVEKLTTEMLKSILTEPKNALAKQIQKLMEVEDVDIHFTDDAINAIAKYTIERNTGARGLMTVIERITREHRFNAPDLDGSMSSIEISAEDVNKAMRKFHPEGDMPDAPRDLKPIKRIDGTGDSTVSMPVKQVAALSST